MLNTIKKKFSIDNKELNRTEVIAQKVMDMENDFINVKDEELVSLTNEFRQKYADTKSKSEKENLLIKAAALFRVGAGRFDVEKRIPFKVQVIGAFILNNGETAEMRTGEGKSLTAALASYIAVVKGHKVHVVTVNEYLVQRDAEEFRPLYEAFGLSVSYNVQSMLQFEKREAYKADIMYSINSELGFDYLRDNMATSIEERVQQELDFVIIDEADSILIDEARTPLIISGSPVSNVDIYKYVDSFVKTLEKNDYTIDLEQNSIMLNESGIDKAEKAFSFDSFYDEANLDYIQKVNQSLNANYMQIKNVDYVVRNDEILIVDKFTGRIMEGRSYSDGLHQAIEAKEHVTIREETRTMATITYQNFFKIYNKLSGMTGTAKTEEEEFVETYNMRVIEVPTNKPIIRIDDEDEIYSSEESKYEAVADDVEQRNKNGQPILIGTVSVENSERISRILKDRHIRHEVLNAKNHKRESEIIEKAGRHGAVTIATNMAGRGTDIKLDQESKDAGGLAVIATERHESRRIDNQLRGRSGRQGDVGYTKFYVSLEDDLMKKYGGERMQSIVSNLMQETGALKSKTISNSITTAQKRVEAVNYDSRKNLLKYDNVLNAQRSVVYSKRDSLLLSDDSTDFINSSFKYAIEKVIETYAVKNNGKKVTVNVEDTNKVFEQNINGYSSELNLLGDSGKIEDLAKPIIDFAINKWNNQKELFEISGDEIALNISMQILDQLWMDHIDSMTHLRESITLAQYAQKDPLTAYQEEGYVMFEEFIYNFYLEAMKVLTFINPSRT